MNKQERSELWWRLDRAHADAQSKRQVADQAVRDRGAIIEALVLDGVTLADIGRQLGVSKQRAGQLLSAYRERVAAE